MKGCIMDYTRKVSARLAKVSSRLRQARPITVRQNTIDFVVTATFAVFALYILLAIFWIATGR
jgi:hypothetical protein